MCQLDPDQLSFVEKRIRRIRSAELETSIGSFFIYLYFSLGQLSFDLSPQVARRFRISGQTLAAGRIDR